jgi:SpoVK/Ycf46/Vps4 family AAA+-type ATPase/RNA polymerase-binding transcription factor DksA
MEQQTGGKYNAEKLASYLLKYKIVTVQKLNELVGPGMTVNINLEQELIKNKVLTTSELLYFKSFVTGYQPLYRYDYKQFDVNFLSQNKVLVKKTGILPLDSTGMDVLLAEDIEDNLILYAETLNLKIDDIKIHITTIGILGEILRYLEITNWEYPSWLLYETKATRPLYGLGAPFYELVIYESNENKIYIDDVHIDPPGITYTNALTYEKDYDASFFLSVISDIDGETNSEYVYFGTFPLLTPRNTFIVQGKEINVTPEWETFCQKWVKKLLTELTQAASYRVNDLDDVSELSLISLIDNDIIQHSFKDFWDALYLTTESSSLEDTKESEIDSEDNTLQDDQNEYFSDNIVDDVELEDCFHYANIPFVRYIQLNTALLASLRILQSDLIALNSIATPAGSKLFIANLVDKKTREISYVKNNLFKLNNFIVLNHLDGVVEPLTKENKDILLDVGVTALMYAIDNFKFSNKVFFNFAHEITLEKMNNSAEELGLELLSTWSEGFFMETITKLVNEIDMASIFESNDSKIDGDLTSDPANLPISAKEMRELIKTAREDIMGDALPNLEKQYGVLLEDSVNPDMRIKLQPEGDQIGIERDLNFKIADEYRLKLSELDIMLDRVEKGVFMYCRSCLNIIPPARLRIRPQSFNCVPCATKLSVWDSHEIDDEEYADEFEEFLNNKHSVDNKSEKDLLETVIDKYFSGLFGLDVIKEYIREVYQLHSYRLARKENQMSEVFDTSAGHIILKGNPGTGKTTVARLIANVFHELGIFNSDKIIEVSRPQLVSPYPGQTAILTHEICVEALGGVLFIDEAYTLAGKDGVLDPHGMECIETLLKFMEDNKGAFTLVLAGYPSEMSGFLSLNPGLYRRFNKTLELPDYSLDDLTTMFFTFCDKNNFMYKEGFEKAVKDRLRILIKDSRAGNASIAKKLFNEVAQNLAKRVYESRSLGNNSSVNLLSLSELLESDIPSMVIPKPTDILAKLNALTGLSAVKTSMSDIVSHYEISQKRINKGLKVSDITPHYVFAGPPGTGKTTVAKYLGEILFSIGALPTSSVVVVDRSGLVANYVGQTTTKTLERCKEALGGVLFVDEAYTLYEASNEHNYGNEALTTILNFMETHRGEISVVFAGYENEINELLNSNPGLKSRFANVINFNDYSVDELTTIFGTMAQERGYTVTDSLKELVRDRLYLEVGSENFGNARGVRNLLDSIVIQQSRRLSEGSTYDRESLSQLISDDLIF